MSCTCRYLSYQCRILCDRASNVNYQNRVAALKRRIITAVNKFFIKIQTFSRAFSSLLGSNLNWNKLLECRARSYNFFKARYQASTLSMEIARCESRWGWLKLMRLILPVLDSLHNKQQIKKWYRSHRLCNNFMYKYQITGPLWILWKWFPVSWPISNQLTSVSAKILNVVGSLTRNHSAMWNPSARRLSPPFPLYWM